MPFRLPALFPFSRPKPAGFAFLNPGPLVDGELELIAPSGEWIDAILTACRHPQTLTENPALGQTTRRQLEEFLENFPLGRQSTDAVGSPTPCYYFWLRLTTGPLPIAGGLALRIGRSYDVEMYYGHIGYHVYPPLRGRHLAERACRLIFPLAAQHQLNPLWITCNPDNLPSRRTCERLGGKLVETVPVPEEHPLYQRGDTDKCRFRIDL